MEEPCPVCPCRGLFKFKLVTKIKLAIQHASKICNIFDLNQTLIRVWHIEKTITQKA